MVNLKQAYALNGPLQDVQPMPILSDRDPASSDLGYQIGQSWVNQSTNKAFNLTSDVAGSASWAETASIGSLYKLTADSGEAVPSSGNIDLLGTAAQGVSTSGAGNTITLTADDATTSQKGVIETATDGETQAKASTTAVLTPSNLLSIGASTTYVGLVELSSDVEAQDQSSTTTALTPSKIAYLRDSVTNVVFNASPIAQNYATTGIAPAGANGTNNILIMQDGIGMMMYMLGTQTILAPRMSSTGLLMSLDLTSGDGAEYNFRGLTNSKHVYTIGESPAFYMELVINVADTSGLSPLIIGFREVIGNSTSMYGFYKNFAGIGLDSAVASEMCVVTSFKNSVTISKTNTGDSWTDGQTKTLRINVSESGVVTYLIDGVPPTFEPSYTFTDDLDVMPFMRHTFSATSPGNINWISMKIGYQ